MLAINQASIKELETKSITDEQLVKGCQQGDCHSFRLLYRRYQQRVRSTLYQLCGSEMLEDLVQEVFLRAWKGLPQLRESSYFSTWLYRISWNVASDRRKKLAKHQPQLNQTKSKFDSDESNLNLTSSSSQDTPDLMRLHYQDLVQRGLQTLSLEHRAVLILHDLEDLPQQEIAQILNIPKGTVKSRLYYARNALKKFLQQQDICL
ncbi:RNA polymerase, sigma subunit, ECF family [Stanieria cyanosphaera PCC 7437]|uniref:RNA polymerase, sigma subunit, ECF family n=1 Tax=Stanieria cyanosphaera (strain ATCC 29371 / PCC 7437) TaxID=111780 RepID=K9XXK0_STAC7|nr:sigma-70 family RNA polymerase sigma factor [Stanieria cyanosphaera]AFZ37325.1 RNA polymerase, sigma subunit, ECF family [Stanieria cyanosphaera PCC 7437]